MAYDIIESKQNQVSLLNNRELGDIIKPLTNEIHLFDTYVAGTTHLDDPTVLDTVVIGMSLNLQRENNKFDDKAILILTENRRKLGYVPERDNIIFSRLMDAGKLLKAKVSQIEKRGGFTQISIQIYLVDF